MDFTDWMLALHLIAAFAVAAALVLYSVLVFSGRRMQTLEETRTLFRTPARSNVNVPVRPSCVSLQTAIDPFGALRLQKTSVDSVSGPPAGMTTEAVAPRVQARRPG